MEYFLFKSDKKFVMLIFEVPFQYGYKQYVAFVRRMHPLPYIISVKGETSLSLPDPFIFKTLSHNVDPLKYRYPGLSHKIADAIRQYCVDHKIPH